jgi:hypothetical protein
MILCDDCAALFFVWENIGYFCGKISTMVITYEVLGQEALAILEQLEHLHLVRKVSIVGAEKSLKPKESSKNRLKELAGTQTNPLKRAPKIKMPPLREKTLAGLISSDTVDKMMSHVEQLKTE